MQLASHLGIPFNKKPTNVIGYPLIRNGTVLRGHITIIRACAHTYACAPDEDAMKSMDTELSRKFDLFYKFIMEMFRKSFPDG